MEDIVVDPASMSILVGGIGIASLLFMLAIFVVIVIAWWKIFKKAGYPAWYAILMFIPFVNLVIFFVFAFGQWPILKGHEAAPAPAPPTPEPTPAEPAPTEEPPSLEV